MRSLARATCIVVAVPLVATSCVNPFGESAKETAAASTSPLLVPDDARFSDVWEFTLEEEADNYTFRSNWDPAFNPDIDKSSLVTGFQINDVETWTGEADSENAEFTAAMRGLPADSEPASGADACEPFTEDPEVVRCVYDLGDAGILAALVRRIENESGTTILVAYDDEEGTVTEDFVAGSFTAVPVDEAADRWLVES